MKELNNKSAELSYYGLYLLSYLREYHPDRVHDMDFILSRGDHAAAVFESSRLSAYTPEGAQELALVALLEGLHFSKYHTLLDVLLNEFSSEVPEDTAPAFALKLLPELEEVFAKYSLSDSFSSAPEYTDLYTELTGTIVIYVNNNPKVVTIIIEKYTTWLVNRVCLLLFPISNYTLCININEDNQFL